MSDNTVILEQKNAVIKHVKLMNAGLVILSLILIAVIIFLALLARIQPPSLNANVDVITNTTPLVVPDVITSGVPFTYTTTGFKNSFDGANGIKEAPTGRVNLQYTCDLGDGKKTTFPFLEYYASGGAGKYTVKRETALPVTARVRPADSCRLEFFVTYTLYVTNKNGETNTINFIEKNISNKFKLVVLPTDTSQNVTNITVQNPVATISPSSLPENTSVAQYQTPPNSTSTTTNNTTINNPPAAPAQNTGLVRGLFDGIFDNVLGYNRSIN